MKVALVHAGVSDGGFNATGGRRRLVWLHHGLASLASSLKSAGHEIDLIDLRQLGSWDDLKKAVVAASPQAVGVSMMSVEYGPAVEAARIVKAAFPRTPVIVGGAHPTLCPDEVAKEAVFDYIMCGEGEIGLVRLVEALGRGERPERVLRGEMPDLERLPFVDREVFGAGEMPIDHFLRIPFVTVIAGRGCRYRCSFCQPAERKIFGEKVRRRSVGNVIAELEELRRRRDFQSMMLHDDCLTEDKAWVTEFCGAYRAGGFRQPFVCQSRADLITRNPDMVKQMARAGLAMFLIGFESGNQRVLNFLKKGTTVAQNLEANRICRRLGVRVWANYMLGIPTETKEEALDTLRMIRTIKPYRASPAFFTPHPGSELYEYCKREGLSLIRDHRDYGRSPDGEKLKGVDYVFLKEVLEESRKVPFSVRIRRKIDHIRERKIKKHVRKIWKRLRHAGSVTP